MVFFTSILIVCILYYLQADGLIYVTIIAVVAELMNMFMTQTLTKSVEKKLNTQWGKKAAGYKNQITAKEKTIKEMKEIHEKSAQKIYMANKRIKAYEEKFGGEDSDPKKDMGPSSKKDTSEPKKKRSKEYDDLPCGSDGIKRRI